MLTPSSKKQIRARKKLTLIEEDLKLKMELQEVKHEFKGLLENFQSYDKELLHSQLTCERKTKTNEIDDARQRIRTIYAHKRSHLISDKENNVIPLTNHYTSKKKCNDNSKIVIDHAIDTSAWSDNESDSINLPDNKSSKKIDINNISDISGKMNFNEYLLNSTLTGSFSNQKLHSTLNYPLHSTIIEEHEDHEITTSHLTKISTKSKYLHYENNINLSVNKYNYPIRSRSLKRQKAQVQLEKPPNPFTNSHSAMHLEKMNYNTGKKRSSTCHCDNCIYITQNKFYISPSVTNKRKSNYFINNDNSRQHNSKRLKTDNLANIEIDMSNDKELKYLKASVRRKFRYFKRCSSQDTIHTLAHF